MRPRKSVTKTTLTPRSALAELLALPGEQARRYAAILPDEVCAALLGTLHKEFAAYLEIRAEAWAMHAAAPRAMPLGPDYERDLVGHWMEPSYGTCSPSTTVEEATKVLRDLHHRVFTVYLFVVDQGRLVGVLTPRELLLASKQDRVDDLMLRRPFHLRDDEDVEEAWQRASQWQLPAYPVCNDQGHLVGVLRGAELARLQAEALASQAGRLVGVAEEDRTNAPWFQSLSLRLPWMAISLATVALGAAVVGAAQSVIERFALLAVFLPVLAGQSANAGNQGMAVCLRGLALGELRRDSVLRLFFKESLIALLGGLFAGLVAGVGMLFMAHMLEAEYATVLAITVAVSMVGSCLVGGAAGAILPIILSRMGSDPAGAAGILISMITDVVSFGLLLGIPWLWLSN